MVERGQLWWIKFPRPHGSEPGYTRPALVIQADGFNKSRINTVVVVSVTSNLKLATAPGNVRLTKARSGLPKESVANVSQISTVNKSRFTEQAGRLDNLTMQQVDEGLKLVLNI
jgi:mRNA interferase MazF